MRYTKLVTNTGRDIFAQYGQKRRYHAGGLISEYGALQNCLIFVSKGEVRAFCSNSSGDEITLFYLHEDSIVSLQASIELSTAPVSIDAVTDVEAYFLDADIFINRWMEKGYSVKDLLAHYVRRIVLLSDYLCCTHFSTNEARLAYFLHSTHTDTDATITYSRDQIAAVTGMSRVSVDRILKLFESDGVIKCGYKKIDVKDPERLEKYFGTVGYLIG